MNDSSEMNYESELQQAVDIYLGLIEEIKKSDYLKTVLNKEPWLETAVNKWELYNKGAIDEFKIIQVAEDLSGNDGAKIQAKEFLMKKLEMYLAEYRYKKAKFGYERTIIDIEEAVFAKIGKTVDNEAFFLGGLFVGIKDPVKTTNLYEELIDYTLAISGYEKKSFKMDMMSEMFHAPLVKEYIEDLEKEVKRLPIAELHQFIDSIIRNSEGARNIANNVQISKPIRHFAQMVVYTNYCKLDCDSHGFSV